MLAAQVHNIVLSEVPVIDQVLRIRFQRKDVSEELQINYLKSIIRAVGRPKNKEEKNLFIKLDCWHIFFLGIIKKAFPDIPFVFLYRDPMQVLNSHNKKAGIQMIPGVLEAGIMNILQQISTVSDLKKYRILVLQKMIQTQISEYGKSQALLINYNEGPVKIMNRIAGFSGIEFSLDELEKMKERSKFHSKFAANLFSEEKVKIDNEDLEEIREYLLSLNRSYLSIEELRHAQMAELSY
jgi:hypothetical protein